MAEIRLNLGCGKDIRKGYVNIDLGYEHPAVVKHDAGDLSAYADGSVAEVRAIDVLEHFPLERINPVLDEWIRVLRPGGMLILKTHCIERIMNVYYPQAVRGEITWERLSRIIHGNPDIGLNSHYVTFSFPWLRALLETRGMKVVHHSHVFQNMRVRAVKRGKA